MTHPESKDKDFSRLEDKALESASLNASSLDALTSDLQRYINKNHRKQMEEIEEKIAKIEERCCQEIRETLAKHTVLQFRKHFQEVVDSCQDKISHMFSSLLGKVEEDIRSLNNEINRTNRLCEEIQNQYKFRWSKPFLTLIGATALTGAFMGIGLFLLQMSPVAVFLMNEETRRLYDLGKANTSILDLYKNLQDKKKASEPPKKKSSR